MTSTRRSLRPTILLGTAMIILLVILTVGWVLLSVFGAQADDRFPAFYWTLLPVGTIFLALVLAGVVFYLAMSIRTISFNRRQENFIDSVTHELKSPIASLKLFLQTLNSRRVTEEERAEFQELMLKDVGRLDQLINHLLDAAKLGNVAEDGEMESVSLDVTLRECADAARFHYGTPESSVHLDIQPCRVRARRGDLDLIFRNLIDNAIKYAGDEPRVEVILRQQTDHTTVTRIRDNGRGVPRRMRKKIFGRFERLGLELEREKPGTGLGLYIVRTLVKKLHGRIRVREGLSQRGAEFEIELPGEPLVLGGAGR